MRDVTPYVIAVLMLCCGSGEAQWWQNPSQICLSLNDASTPFQSLLSIPLELGGHVDIVFAVPSTLFVDGIDVFLTACPSGHSVQVGVHQLNSGVFGAPLATGVIAGGCGWQTAQIAGVTLSGGIQYGLRCVPSLGLGLFQIGVDPAGTVFMGYSVTCLILPSCTGFPATGSAPIRLRFRGAPCGVGASGGTVGMLCGSYTSLAIGGPPAIGTTFLLNLWTVEGIGATAHLYWSLGVNLQGSAIGGTACMHYLDVSSFQWLWQIGLEPLVSVAAIPLVTQWSWSIPFDPGLVGTVVTCQVLLEGVPWNTGIQVGTTYIAITKAVQLNIGY